MRKREMSAQAQNEPSPGDEFISFRLGKDRFAVEAPSVRAVMKHTHITEVPGMPDFLPGVINLRGNVISVIDLCPVLGISPIAERKTAWLVITEVRLENELLRVGMLVNTVEDVVRLNASQMDPSPEIGMRFDTQFVRGIGKQDGDFTIILDVEKVVAAVDVAVAQMSGQETAERSRRPV